MSLRYRRVVSSNLTLLYDTADGSIIIDNGRGSIRLTKEEYAELAVFKSECRAVKLLDARAKKAGGAEQ